MKEIHLNDKLDFLWVNDYTSCTLMLIYRPFQSIMKKSTIDCEKRSWNIHQQQSANKKKSPRCNHMCHDLRVNIQFILYFFLIYTRMMWKNNFHISLASHDWLNEKEIYLFASTSTQWRRCAHKVSERRNKLSVNDQCWLDNDL